MSSAVRKSRKRPVALFLPSLGYRLYASLAVVESITGRAPVARPLPPCVRAGCKCAGVVYKDMAVFKGVQVRVWVEPEAEASAEAAPEAAPEAGLEAATRLVAQQVVHWFSNCKPTVRYGTSECTCCHRLDIYVVIV